MTEIVRCGAETPTPLSRDERAEVRSSMRIHDADCLVLASPSPLMTCAAGPRSCSDLVSSASAPKGFTAWSPRT
jgi:hypothetical protein